MSKMMFLQPRDLSMHANDAGRSLSKEDSRREWVVKKDILQPRRDKLARHEWAGRDQLQQTAHRK